jgi:hypothetical protein
VQQTFFPIGMTKQQIIEQFATALANPNKQLAAGFSRMYEAKSQSGLVFGWFEGTKYTSGIESFFPRL